MDAYKLCSFYESYFCLLCGHSTYYYYTIQSVVAEQSLCKLLPSRSMTDDDVLMLSTKGALTESVVTNPASHQLNEANGLSLFFPFVPESLVSWVRIGFLAQRQSAHSPQPGWIRCRLSRLHSNSLLAFRCHTVSIKTSIMRHRLIHSLSGHHVIAYRCHSLHTSNPPAQQRASSSPQDSRW